jgi:hypothetical protein
MFFSGASSSQALAAFLPRALRSRNTGSSVVANQKTTAMSVIPTAQTWAVTCQP